MARKGKHRPFASKAQARLFFARPDLRKYAKKKAHATGMRSAVTKRLGHSPAYDRLPERKSTGAAGAKPRVSLRSKKKRR